MSDLSIVDLSNQPVFFSRSNSSVIRNRALPEIPAGFVFAAIVLPLSFSRWRLFSDHCTKSKSDVESYYSVTHVTGEVTEACAILYRPICGSGRRRHDFFVVGNNYSMYTLLYTARRA